MPIPHFQKEDSTFFNVISTDIVMSRINLHFQVKSTV